MANNNKKMGKRSSYPLPAYLSFCPGGICYDADSVASNYYMMGSIVDPTVLISQAAQADLRWNTTVTNTSKSKKEFPSLSLLMEAALHPLTGVPASNVKLWLDAALVEYAALDDNTRATLSTIQQRLIGATPTSRSQPPSGGVTPSQLLQQLFVELPAPSDPQSSRPCGYVFRSGDIAWNCRTCETDPTCVLCDQCFHASNHEGHEVYFHRTSPGGCCDCGDVEAWRLEGCCPAHRPKVNHDAKKQDEEEDTSTTAVEFEAVRAARRARLKTEASLKILPSTLGSALGVVVGAAVQCVLKAADGCGVGADLSQWKIRWAEQIASIVNGVAHEEEYMLHQGRTKESFITPHIVLQLSSAEEATTTDSMPTKWDGQFPDRFRLHLRLHNDDVHTYDEVIKALHEPSSSSSSVSSAMGTAATERLSSLRLVADHDSAERMTQHVDTDGQVTVKTYTKISAASAGFLRLKQAGLLCSVVSTPQVDMELRARTVLRWLTDLIKWHPAIAGVVTHALVDVTGGDDVLLGDAQCCAVWCEARLRAPWDRSANGDLYTREALRKLWLLQPKSSFYEQVPFRLPSTKFYKSPHALWGTLLSPSDYTSVDSNPHYSIIDTDLRKQQETISVTTSTYPHRLAGLNLISGVALLQDGYVNLDGRIISGTEADSKSCLIASMLTIPYKELQPILSKSSYIAPISPLLIMLLLDPYSTKQFRSMMHNLWLNLLVDGRFKSRFAAALGTVAYRSLTTLYCAGVGTEQDSPLGFTVQIFTVKSLVSALSSSTGTRLLLDFDPVYTADISYNHHLEEKNNETDQQQQQNNTATLASLQTRTLPIALSIVRILHTNILGSTKEVRMLIEHTSQGHLQASSSSHQASIFAALDPVLSSPNGYLPALVYQNGENPALDILPAAPDDDFLDSRTTKHKRLPQILRDLEYVFEAGTTAIDLLQKNPWNRSYSSSISQSPPPFIDFCTAFARLLRLTQGMDIQKRKISGGHVEYESLRWYEAFALSLNLACSRDALVDSPTCSHIQDIGQLRSSMGNLFTSLIREIKLFLYREDLLESGLLPASYLTNSALPQAESPQRSTLHVPCLRSSTAGSSHTSSEQGVSNNNNVALACPTGVKMTEAQLCLIEQALRVEYGQGADIKNSGGVMMGDWLKVPHSPLSGDPLSFHLPLHRTLAKAIISFCAVAISESDRLANPKGWWKLPIVDGVETEGINLSAVGGATPQTYVAALLAPTLRTSNCKIVWQLTDTSPEHLHVRRLRQYQISSILAAVKVIHSLADLPIRCLAASAQIERHMWTRNGSSISGMAINYSTAPLCRSFRDLDLNLVQFSAAGFDIGLGVRRVLALILNRFNMDGYLEDPKLQSHGTTNSRRSSGYWKSPPRLQDPEHAPLLAESVFALVCVLVTELPPPPPSYLSRDMSLSDGTLKRIRRELLHTLAAEPKSYSEAFKSVSGLARRDMSVKSGHAAEGTASSIRPIFSNILRTIAKERSSSNPSAGAPVFELSASCSDEYDPTFYHLRRIEHQHAMDLVARLRHQKCKDLATENSEKKRSSKASNGLSNVNDVVLPIVQPPPDAHPRFLPARLLLHLPALDAAIRRKLYYALFGGEWLPPEPSGQSETRFNSNISATSSDDDGDEQLSASSTSLPRTGARRAAHVSFLPAKEEFGPRAVQSSSVSSLEVLQLLTLQIHTLESMASLHRSPLGDSLDPEAKELSRSLNVNRYLSRLIYVPESVEGLWVIDPQVGPLPSAGSGKCRGSILGVLIALWEHSYCGRSTDANAEHSTDKGVGMSSSGGARALASDGLKWILRFVHSLVDGASSVKAAIRSATDGVRISSNSATTGWTLATEVQETVQEMLHNIPKLWPDNAATLEALPEGAADSLIKDNAGLSARTDRTSTNPAAACDAAAESKVSIDISDSPDNDFKAKLAARKAAQTAAMERMKKQQAAFAASLAAKDDDESDADGKDTKPNTELDFDSEEDDDSSDCIICRCGAKDSDSPLCFLGHVQRSRVLSLRNLSELSSNTPSMLTDGKLEALHVGQAARVVGDKGCQLRVSCEMDSPPVACLPMGSIVFIIQSKVSSSYGILSRRVFVRHVPSKRTEKPSSPLEGWASVQSSQGYIILAPLTNLCFGRWGATRPLLRLCGHAAHLGCVDSYCLNLRQRHEADQPYDGRFAANIKEGEFLCPLCKQLSNVLVPNYKANRSLQDSITSEMAPADASHNELAALVATLRKRLRVDNLTFDNLQGSATCDATRRFGEHLYEAMEAPWVSSKRQRHHQWNKLLSRWDFEGSLSNHDDSIAEGDLCIGSTMKDLRQLHISWALLGHGAASSEASARYSFLHSTPNLARASGCRDNNKNGFVFTDTETYETRISDPWLDYNTSVRDSHPLLIEAKRITLATCGIFDKVSISLGRLTAGDVVDVESSLPRGSTLLGLLLIDILEGKGNGWPYLLDPKNTSLDDPMCLFEWKLLSGCLASMPCHVARDGSLSLRSEARALATSMWILDGFKTQQTDVENMPDSLPLSDSYLPPPMPLAVRKLLADENSQKQLLQCFGTSSATEYLRLRDKNPGTTSPTNIPPPYRPAFASGFLYMPLLAWDLNTYSGALFCALLHSGSATPDDLVSASKLLLAGRVIQILISPNGYKLNSSSALADGLSQLTPEDILREAQALVELQYHCCQVIDSSGTGKKDISVVASRSLLQAVSSAILPFARTIVLLLRAGFSILRLRSRSDQRSHRSNSNFHAFDSVARVLEDSAFMSCHDGLFLLKALGGPLPSELIIDLDAKQQCNGWLAILDRWLACIVNLESHHGSCGRCNHFDSKLNKWMPQYVSTVDEQFDELSRQHDHKNLTSTGKNAGQSRGPKSAIDTGLVFNNAASASANEERLDRSVEASDFAAMNALAESDTNPSEDADMDDLASNENGASDYFGDNFLIANDDASSGNEEMMDEATDDTNLSAIANHALSPSSDIKVEDDAGECSIVDGFQTSDHSFADVSTASIIPFQPSFLARGPVGPGPRGSAMDLLASSKLLYDMSHLGLVHQRDLLGSGLITLPYSFVELYNLVNKVRGYSSEESDENSNGEVVICLLTGSVLRSGTPRRSHLRQKNPPGACTLHARKVGSGVGIFFLVQKCIVLLVDSNKSAYSPSLYVDENGEEDLGLKRGRPLFLNEARLQTLEALWRNNGIPREVTQIRSTSDRVIRDNWY